MPKFSQKSLDRLATADPRLQVVFHDVIENFDCTILCGHRGQEEQEADYAAHTTLEHWPNSKHNKIPSLAVDAMPYPVDWKDRDRIALFAGIVMGSAHRLGIKVRWGGSFETLKDLDHFELVEEA